MMRKNTSQSTGQRAASRGDRDRTRRLTSDQIGSLSPLTSVGADSQHPFRLGDEWQQVVCMYPVLPETLREADTPEAGCRGLVAEPMN